MKKIHKIVSVLILLTTALIAFLFKVQMTDTVAQNLVIFLSVVFGFHVISIGILYNATYIKNLHKQIDKKARKRGTHILRSYLLISGYWSIFSIISIIFFSTVATQSLLLSSGLFGIAMLNVFYVLLLMRTIIDGMIEEAKK